MVCGGTKEHRWCCSGPSGHVGKPFSRPPSNRGSECWTAFGILLLRRYSQSRRSASRLSALGLLCRAGQSLRPSKQARRATGSCSEARLASVGRLWGTAAVPALPRHEPASL